MKRIINGKLYNTETAEELCSNEYRQNSANRLNNGRCTTIYKTKSGLFFAYHETRWQGERDNIEPLTIADAKQYFEDFDGNADCYDEIFGEPPIDTDAQPDSATKRLRQVRDALNKCKKSALIEQIGKLLNV